MKRKVVQQGPSTLMVSLPSKWVKELNICRGDEIDLIEQDGGILLTKEPNHEKLSVSYDVTGFTRRAVKWVMNIAYKKGYDEVCLYSDSADTSDFITKDIFICPGYDISEQTNKRIVLVNIAKSIDPDFKSLFRKDFLNMEELFSMMHDSLKKNDFSSTMKLDRFFEFSDKISSLGGRISNVELGKSNKNAFYYVLFWYHEKIVDRLKYLFNYLCANPETKISKSVIDIFDDTRTLFKMYYDLFYKFEIKKINDALALQKKIRQKCYEEMGDSKGKQNVAVHHLAEVCEMLVECVPNTIAINTEKYELK